MASLLEISILYRAQNSRDKQSTNIRYGLLLLLAVSALRGATPCPSPHDVQPGDNLEKLAVHELGNARYAIAIVLATNSRTGDDGFSYIANPDDLTGIPRVCIPSKAEADRLAKGWKAYDRAVAVARLPRLAEVNNALLTIPPDQPVNVVAWVRKDQVERLKTGSGDWVKIASAETWVTIEPHLRTFCRAFVHDHQADEARLTARLEQRLGLSPASSKTFFIRIRLDHPGPSVIFRPCANPAADRAACSTGGPASSDDAYQQWFYKQYYSSYGQSLLSEFPWTSLGYTFDWAPGATKRSAFQRMGESEFVLHKGAPIEIQEVLPTAQYCAPQGP